jgi:hypothetical protein
MGVMTALVIGSLAAQAYSSYKQGKAAKKAGEAGQTAAESQADLADYNAQVATVQADDAVARGGEEESRFRAGTRGLIGTERAGQAAGNVDVGYGSALDVQADTAYLGELDALTIRTNAAREAWGYKVQAEDLHARARIARRTGVMVAETGRAQANAAYLGGASNLLAGSANLYQAKYGFKAKTPAVQAWTE